MKDVILSDSPEELEQASSSVNANEAEVLDLFRVVRNNFLGDPGSIVAAELAFVGWKPIRDNVIGLKRAGANREAAYLSKNESAAYIENLLTLMNGLDEFAHNKALEFLDSGIAEQDQARRYSYFMMAFSMSLGAFIAIFGAIKLSSDARKLQEFAIAQQSHAQVLKTTLIDSLHAFALTVEMRDPYTAGHMGRVAELAVAIARKLDSTEHDIDGIRLGASIHDLGKISLPIEILTRPGKLSAAEFELIKTHSQIGYDIIKNIEFPWPIAGMVLYHHERLDGSGYPKGLKGNEIPFEAQLLSVADVVEAVCSYRPYRESLGMGAALKIIKEGRGSLFNPEIVDVCVELIEKEGFKFTKKD